MERLPRSIPLRIHTYSNMDVLSLALEKGDVDAFYKYAGTYPYTSIQKLKDTGNFEFMEKDNIGLIFLGMNLKEGTDVRPQVQKGAIVCRQLQRAVKAGCP